MALWIAELVLFSVGMVWARLAWTGRIRASRRVQRGSWSSRRLGRAAFLLYGGADVQAGAHFAANYALQTVLLVVALAAMVTGAVLVLRVRRQSARISRGWT